MDPDLGFWFLCNEEVMFFLSIHHPALQKCQENISCHFKMNSSDPKRKGQ